MKKMIVWSLCFLIALVIGVVVYLQHPKFGRAPEGARLAAIKNSPNYVDGEFRYQIATPVFTEDKSFATVLMENLGSPGERPRPVGDIPVVKADFRSLDVHEDMVMWLGHSSFYVQLAGQSILIDPVFSEVASPIPFVNRAFAGTTAFSATDMPPIDHLLISHDHWDHLDYPSVTNLRPKVGQVVSGLGMGAYFQEWGFEPTRIVEGDWFDSVSLSDKVTLHFIPARHYSGRALTRNRTLWVGFVLETAHRRLLFSGDSGYGPHFAEIGKRFDGFDLVALDHGQYDSRWAYIHMTPEEAATAAEELGADALMPTHVGRFTLARHAWDEPLQRITVASKNRPYRLVTPKIGEAVNLSGRGSRTFPSWW